VHTATSFTAVDGKLAAGGNAAWSADRVAHGFAKVKVWAGADHDRRVSIVWRGA
jgi:ribonuclease T2